jgi:dTDP-4-amino-4,6-dideoxygalactose transaminase
MTTVHKPNHAATITLPSDQNASGRSFGPEEIDLLRDVIRSGTLTSTKGTKVKELERRLASHLGVQFASACSSGTAAVHSAIAALDLEPGQEIVTSPITDMGALTPILYQGAIPVFADVDPWTYNITAKSIEARLSDRSRAVIVTHLFGNPCDMNSIVELAERHGLFVIEDCAQAYGASVDGRPVGSIGSIGCFSFQQGKHMTAGEGGFVVTDDATLARRMFLFINKAWGYGDENPDHYFLALNYRLSELQGAVALAQLEKLEENVSRRRTMAERLTGQLTKERGVDVPRVGEGHAHSYWKYALNVDPQRISGGPHALAAELKRKGIPSAPGYVGKPAFQCAVFRDQRTFGSSRYPFTLARKEALDFSPGLFPGTFEALKRILVLPWNERFTEEHVDHIATSIHEATARATTSSK